MPRYDLFTFLAPSTGSFTFDASNVEVLAVTDSNATFGDNNPSPPEGYSNQAGQNDVFWDADNKELDDRRHEVIQQCCNRRSTQSLHIK